MRITLLFLVYGIFVLGIKSAWQMTGDFLLLAVIFFGFFEERTWAGLWLSLLLGYLLDVVSAIPMGAGMFSYALTYGFIRRLRTKILFQSFPSQFFWIFVLTLLNGLFLFGWISLFGHESRPLYFFLKNLLWNAFVTALLGLFVLPFLQRYARWHWARWFTKKDPLLKR